MNTTTTSAVPTVSKKAAELFHSIRRYASTTFVAAEVWERLTPQQRQLCGTDLRDAMERHRNVIHMWKLVFGVSYQQAVIEIGRRLDLITTGDADWLLREGGELPRDETERKAAAIARGDLVIIEHSKTIFWRGKPVEADWSRNGESWEFVVLAARRAKHNRPIDYNDFGSSASTEVVAKKKSRLSKRVPSFPIDLLDAFKIVERGRQKWDIPADQIHII